MIQNYIKLGLRHLYKQRAYSLLNVFGLGLSIGCSILIFMLVCRHLSFDTYHKNADRILRIVMDIHTENTMPFSGVPNPMAKVLREESAQIEQAAMRSAQDEVLISVENAAGGRDKYKEEGLFAWVEPAYFDILDLPLLRGDAAALSEPNTVVLSEKLAAKYFGNADPLGKTIRKNNRSDLRVVGIMQDLPENTDYKQEILASWTTLKTLPETARDIETWDGARGETYCFALLKPGQTLETIAPFVAGINKKYPHPDQADLFVYKAKPMLGLHFDPDYGQGIDKKFLWALGFIGLFLLLTACVNFINMATALAITRSREVGVRKSLGSTRSQLFWQFMSETGLIVTASLAFGFLLAWLSLPYLNTWLDETLHFDPATLSRLFVFALVLGIVLSFLAGAYPGLMQARFNPVLAMKGGAASVPRNGGLPLRKLLVTSQFAISQILIIGAAVVATQMRFAQDADWGYRPGALLTLEIPEIKQGNNLKQELLAIAGVKSVALCYQPPASTSNNHTGLKQEFEPKQESWLVNDKPGDEHYLETFGLQLLAGRNLQHSDTLREYVVNETFVKKLNLASAEEVLNKKIALGNGKMVPIVGVVRDFHNLSLIAPISPIAIGSFSDNYSTCAVQLNPGNPAPVLEQIRQVWERQFPEQYFESRFMDERIGDQLKSEMRIMRLLSCFAGIAILIGCLGLFGLAAFLVTQKRKEVGIRKTLGASIPGILWLFGKEYASLILLAFVLAAPLAWWVMESWLQDYAYRISLSAGVFLVSLLVTFGVAALTVGIQSVRAALANPVKSLRSE